MNTANMVFERNLFNLSLYSLSVAKSVNENGVIMLNVEKNGTRVAGYDTVYFADDSEYDTFLDAYVSEHDSHYNKARALDCVLDALEH